MIRFFTVCYSICIFLRHFSAVSPICKNFRGYSNILSVRKFRTFYGISFFQGHSVNFNSITVPSGLVVTMAPVRILLATMFAIVKTVILEMTARYGLSSSFCGQLFKVLLA